jgi:hypothetical protein
LSSAGVSSGISGNIQLAKAKKRMSKRQRNGSQWRIGEKHGSGIAACGGAHALAWLK